MEHFVLWRTEWLAFSPSSADNIRMFVREKTARGHSYLYLVESMREGGRVRQRIVQALGRKDLLLVNQHRSGTPP